MSEKPKSAFEQAASELASENLITELWRFLKQTKKWWLLPILAVLLLFAVLMLISATAAGPFIYTLF